ncbi:MAG: aspartyl/glutamyl-tRNA amidotransferase subunit C [Treponema sp.]|jgi:aspartyl-tRNA(Asn)/glutamyl-tRNA(Gln) amidotransferase subunit C|nr:aspartyl/glutamyl-tRNA amidotransferase subunit C [Treponema sp.]
MDQRELEETAGLAHLNVNGEELAAALPAFEQMLGFFAVMQDAAADPSVSTAETAAGQTAVARLVSSGHFRGDAAPEGAAVSGKEILDNAGGRDGAFIVIPNVL